ncbi:hypothetical protein P7K49_028459 [Saguinus oedipus]|uniref:Uncharacterized protein n=1 Tax=Saguinus oedipus TaxID=9490 RepID=A0ABQ9UCF3_SAGOE|nr:hypothetical protein P7K49_028459 [Saguinus oedipus]
MADINGGSIPESPLFYPVTAMEPWCGGSEGRELISVEQPILGTVWQLETFLDAVEYASLGWDSEQGSLFFHVLGLMCLKTLLVAHLVPSFPGQAAQLAFPIPPLVR